MDFDDMRGQFPDRMTTQEIALWWGYSPERIQQLASDDKVLTPSGTREHGKGYVFHPYDAAAEMIAYLKRIAQSRKPSDESEEDAKTRKLIADADWKEYQAEKMRLDVERMKNNLHEALLVAGYIGQLVSQTRAQIEALPGRAAKAILEAAGIVPTKKQELAAIRALETETDGILKVLSEFEYMPEELSSADYTDAPEELDDDE